MKAFDKLRGYLDAWEASAEHYKPTGDEPRTIRRLLEEDATKLEAERDNARRERDETREALRALIDHTEHVIARFEWEATGDGFASARKRLEEEAAQMRASIPAMPELRAGTEGGGT